MDLKQNYADEIVLQLTVEQLAEIASSKKDIAEGLYVENSTFKKEVRTWLKER